MARERRMRRMAKRAPMRTRVTKRRTRRAMRRFKVVPERLLVLSVERGRTGMVMELTVADDGCIQEEAEVIKRQL